MHLSELDATPNPSFHVDSNVSPVEYQIRSWALELVVVLL